MPINLGNTNIPEVKIDHLIQLMKTKFDIDALMAFDKDQKEPIQFNSNG